MSSFNEIQKGLPELGKTYWQDLKGQKDDNTDVDIVKMNCRTIFSKENNPSNVKTNKSIFIDK